MDAGRTTVRERIEHLRDKYGWVFVFLAANQDAVVAGGRMGIAPDRAAPFVASPDGLQRAFNMQCAAVASMRAEGALAADWSREPDEDEDKDEA
ncbi:MAG: hypothetical protein KBA64_09345 [Armatimonadetes bacterium]|nr:hypothetical protein [Armatimonadota bacterium]MDI9601602.1 hypothetical protein [Acidobacteriota bacterium]